MAGSKKEFPYTESWGPVEVTSLGGNNYSLTFQNMHSHEEQAYFMKKKSEAFGKYKDYEAWTRVQRKSVIEILSSDGAVNSNLMNSANICNPRAQFNTLRCMTHLCSGASEFSHRVYIEGTQAMLDASRLPKNLWAKRGLTTFGMAAQLCADVRPTRGAHNGDGEKPNLANLIEWGQKVWVKRTKSPKLTNPAIKGCFVGYQLQ
jgi:hypothetical protein